MSAQPQRRQRGQRRPPADLRPHAEAARVPAMAPEQYAAFRADVKRRGLLSPLEITAEGVVLEGPPGGTR